MEERRDETLQYVPPKVEVIKATEFLLSLGQTLSCSGYGGAVTGC